MYGDTRDKKLDSLFVGLPARHFLPLFQHHERDAGREDSLLHEKLDGLADIVPGVESEIFLAGSADVEQYAAPVRDGHAVVDIVQQDVVEKLRHSLCQMAGQGIGSSHGATSPLIYESGSAD